MEKLIILAACLALFWSADASVDEALEIRIFNPNISEISREELEAMIEHADLPSLGYTKITETIIETDFETGLPVRKETARFLKRMHCNEVADAEAFLSELFPVVLGDDVTQKTKDEIEHQRIDNNPNCMIGVEFHLKRCEYRRREKRRAAYSKGSRGDCYRCKRACVVVIKVGDKGKDGSN